MRAGKRVAEGVQHFQDVVEVQVVVGAASVRHRVPQITVGANDRPRQTGREAVDRAENVIQVRVRRIMAT